MRGGKNWGGKDRGGKDRLEKTRGEKTYHPVVYVWLKLVNETMGSHCKMHISACSAFMWYAFKILDVD